MVLVDVLKSEMGGFLCDFYECEPRKSQERYDRTGWDEIRRDGGRFQPRRPTSSSSIFEG